MNECVNGIRDMALDRECVGFDTRRLQCSSVGYSRDCWTLVALRVLRSQKRRRLVHVQLSAVALEVLLSLLERCDGTASLQHARAQQQLQS